MLGLNKEDVSRVASVSVKSVRYDDAIPEQVRDRLEEIANTINMVAEAFDGDIEKTVAWFRARNPMLGDVSPRDMIRLGRYERLRKFIIHAMSDRVAAQQQMNITAKMH
ncbi:MAG: MbcA/ParS/Xre antitoxin family protein [Burkholderiaceae bacterium]|nr:MbcA/ParS/Xre antitoxin family protein [Burkholderiaceae bacterium]